jgi:PPM family protein phosphatase
MLRIDFDQRTHVGMQRQENQDSMGHFEGPLGRLFVVCDGMGGHAGGQIASSMAVETIGQVYLSLPTNTSPEDALRRSIEAANNAIHQRSLGDPHLKTMGTTCVAMLLPPNSDLAYVAHVGDSRIYRITDGQIERLTRDHTAVQHLIDQGLLTEEQAANHPRSHVINRSLGVLDAVEVEVGRDPLLMRNGDRLLLCTDGLTTMLDDLDIYRFVAQHPLAEAVGELIEITNARGGYDNVTVQLIQVGDPLPLGASAQLKKAPPPVMLSPTTAPNNGGGVAALAQPNWRVLLVITTVLVITLLAILIVTRR